MTNLPAPRYCALCGGPLERVLQQINKVVAPRESITYYRRLMGCLSCGAYVRIWGMHWGPTVWDQVQAMNAMEDEAR